MLRYVCIFLYVLLCYIWLKLCPRTKLDLIIRRAMKCFIFYKEHSQIITTVIVFSQKSVVLLIFFFVYFQFLTFLVSVIV